MTVRLRYAEVAPEGYAALSAFGHYVNAGTALEPVLLGLVYLRASVLNGCAFCTELHRAELRKHNEPESRIDAVWALPGTDAFTPRELAALQWTDVITRLEGSHASDEDYAAVARFFEGKDLVDLTFAIASINAWNRMGVAFQPAWRPRHATKSAAAEESSPSTSERASSEHATADADADRDGSTATTVSAVDDDGGKVATD